MTDTNQNPNDVCGATTQSGNPCENPRTEKDGFCWIHSQHTSTLNEGPSHAVTQAVAQKLRTVPIITHAVESTQGVSVERHYHWIDVAETLADQGDTENRYAEYAESTQRARAEGQIALLAQARQISTDKPDGENPKPADARNLVRIYDRTVAGSKGGKANGDDRPTRIADVPSDDQIDQVIAELADDMDIEPPVAMQNGGESEAED